MTDTEKRINLNSIRGCLSIEQIPFEYNAQDLVIKLKGIDMTDVLLAVHDYSSEKMTDLIKENAELKRFIKDLIYENHNLCFQFSNTTCLFNSDYRNRAEELTGEKL